MKKRSLIITLVLVLAILMCPVVSLAAKKVTITVFPKENIRTGENITVSWTATEYPEGTEFTVYFEVENIIGTVLEEDSIKSYDNPGQVTYTYAYDYPEAYQVRIEIWTFSEGDFYSRRRATGMVTIDHGDNPDQPDEPEEPEEPDEQAVTKVRSFVGRCYNLILDRDAEEGGMTYWAGLLTGKKSTASAIINDFTKSPEFKGRPLTSADKVDILYNTMLDRGADEEGKAYWVSQLDAGVSEAAIINGFCGSEEFATICADYGIEAGSVDVPQPVDPDQPAGEGIEGFVQRCYTKALDRAFDQGGVDYWVEQMRGGLKPQDVARQFIFSEEADAKGRSNDEFIRTMYRLYMGREADEGGLAYWNEQMANGMNREQVNDGFAGSEEFANIVAGFGL